ncbi:MAG: hypothetical protein FVQ81_15800 [Candidatus Glassbacteria bacterium]|nr:hypothetical protein [Candidatus Glassbacteria bacterium]
MPKRKRNHGLLPDGVDLRDLENTTSNDIELLIKGSQQLKPLLDSLREELQDSIKAQPFEMPSKKVWKEIERALPLQYKGLRKNLAQLKGKDLTDGEFNRLIHMGVDKARLATEKIMKPGSGLEEIVEKNLSADGTYKFVGTTLIWNTPEHLPDIVLNTSDSDELTAAEIILITSLIVEVVGFLFALLGVVFPKIDLVKLWNKVLRTRSRRVFELLKKLLEVLMDAQKPIAKKLEAILKFVKALASLGLLSDLIAQIFNDMSWLQLAFMLLQILAQVALWLLPGAQAALVAQKMVAVLSAIVSLTKKARDLAGMLSK